jgi:hypothetical protein
MSQKKEKWRPNRETIATIFFLTRDKYVDAVSSNEKLKIEGKKYNSNPILNEGVRSYFSNFNNANKLHQSYYVAQSIKTHGGSGYNKIQTGGIIITIEQREQIENVIKQTDRIKKFAINISKTIARQLKFISKKQEISHIEKLLLHEITNYYQEVDVALKLAEFTTIIKDKVDEHVLAYSADELGEKTILLEKALKNCNFSSIFFDDDIYKDNKENVIKIADYILDSIAEMDDISGTRISEMSSITLSWTFGDCLDTMIKIVEFAEVLTLPVLLINVMYKKDIADLYTLHHRLYKHSGTNISLVGKCLLPLFIDIKKYDETNVPFFQFNEIISSRQGIVSRNKFMEMMKTMLEHFSNKLKNPINKNEISILSTYFGGNLNLVEPGDNNNNKDTNLISEYILQIITQINKNNSYFDNAVKYIDDYISDEKNKINLITDNKSDAEEDNINLLPCQYDLDDTIINRLDNYKYFNKIYTHISNISSIIHDGIYNYTAISSSPVIEIVEKKPNFYDNSQIFTENEIIAIYQIEGIQTRYIYLYSVYHRYICLLLYKDNTSNFGESIIEFIKNPDVFFFEFETKILEENLDKLRYVEFLYLFMHMFKITIPTGEGIINYIHTRQSMFLITGTSIPWWESVTNNEKIGEFYIVIDTSDRIHIPSLDENISRLRETIKKELERKEKNDPRKRRRIGGGLIKTKGCMRRTFVRKELINRSIRDLYNIQGYGNTLFLDINGKNCVRYTKFMKEKKVKEKKMKIRNIHNK